MAAANAPFPRTSTLRLSVPGLGMEKVNSPFIFSSMPRATQTNFLISVVYVALERRWMYPSFNDAVDLRDILTGRFASLLPLIQEEPADVSAADESED